ncbi:MAG: hypothetical protein FWC76_06800 [Defluviitaleaceae bacterium]|nr:hypothetical protein [Defluviitaleaceae bacterium]
MAKNERSDDDFLSRPALPIHVYNGPSESFEFIKIAVDKRLEKVRKQQANNTKMC